MAKNKKTEVKKVEETPKKTKWTKKNIFIGLFVALFLLQYLQMQTLFGNFSFLQGRDSSLITEIGQVKEAYTQIGDDLNEVRDFLRLDTSQYMGFDDPMSELGDEDQNEDAIQLAMFQYVDFLGANKNLQENVAKNKTMLAELPADAQFAAFLAGKNLAKPVFSEANGVIATKINTTDGKNLVTFNVSQENGKIYMQTVKGEDEVKVKDKAEFVKEAQSFIEKNQTTLLETSRKIEEQKAAIIAAIKAQPTQAEITKLHVTLPAEPTENSTKIIFGVKNVGGEPIGEISFDKEKMKLSLVDLKDGDMTVETNDIGKALIPFLQKLDTQTLIEKKVAEALAEVKKTISDEGFQLLLKQTGFTITLEPREDDERYYFELKNMEGVPVSSLVVEKMTGVVNIVQPDGTNSENILYFDPEFKKKTLEIPEVVPEYKDKVSEDGTFNVLIAGKHGNLVDTMIFAHIDEKRGDVRMISIPRDLQYNGRKINSFAFYYGMPELKKVLSEITGYTLDKYILVDMYAFIDVIDLVGGIDITLEQAVIDPTYRTVDNGVVGTLHYEPGDYHLGGVEALRLARSRHTSSDFARAERQQLILEALQDKARNFGFGDADTIYEIAKTVLSKTETDISVDEGLAYYFRYQNYEIASNNVMSSGNILYAPPYVTAANCQKQIESGGDAGCATGNQAYILIPRDNNWNLIKWFFRENFEE